MQRKWSPFLAVELWGVNVSCFSRSMLLCSDKIRIHVEKMPSLGRCKDFCSSVSVSYSGSLWLSSFGCGSCGNSQSGSSCNIKIKSQMTRNKENNKSHLGKDGNSDSRRLFSLRLRPRLHLLSMRLRRVTSRATLEELKLLLRNNWRRVTFTSLISAVLALCYLFLKFTAVPSPNVVPCSELITSLQSGSVSKVLFEEGSRRIFYNMVSQDEDNLQVSEDQSPSEDIVSESIVDSGVRIEDKNTKLERGVNNLRRFSKTQASTPVWQYSTRKLKHDEKFLLSLMREKGTAYSSAPQSMLMSMRNILITILSLWIPLAPFMWLLYRQLSAANSPAKKR